MISDELYGILLFIVPMTIISIALIIWQFGIRGLIPSLKKIATNYWFIVAVVSITISVWITYKGFGPLEGGAKYIPVGIGMFIAGAFKLKQEL